MLPESLYATTIGFVDMVWSPECQRCSGGVVDKADLCELPNQANCQGCNQANRIDSLDSRSHQSLLYVTARSILLPRNRPGMSRLFQGMHEPIRLSRLHVSDLHRFWLFVRLWWQRQSRSGKRQVSRPLPLFGHPLFHCGGAGCDRASDAQMQRRINVTDIMPAWTTLHKRILHYVYLLLGCIG
jgi:hypothetical protein